MASNPAQDPTGLTSDERAQGLMLVRLTQKFTNRIFHEFHPDHPHKVDAAGERTGEALVVAGRIVKVAPTQSVRAALMGGKDGPVLEEVRDKPATPEPVDVVDVVNASVLPFEPKQPNAAAAKADAADAAAAKAEK